MGIGEGEGGEGGRGEGEVKKGEKERTLLHVIVDATKRCCGLKSFARK